MRKDSHPHYHPRSKTCHGNRAVKKHNCFICRHIECDEVNRKVLEGWRYADIIRAHPWIRHHQFLIDHVSCLGLKDQLDKIREIKLKEILEDIIRAGKPMLDEGKVYPRDMIEAAKTLNELEKKGSVARVWEIIERSGN
jgi:hypothetical protein